jgi:hypothetical protein
MSGSCPAQRLEWVEHGRTICGAKQRLYADPQRPFAPGWLLCVRQQSTLSTHWASLAGQDRPYNVAAKVARNRSFAKVPFGPPHVANLNIGMMGHHGMGFVRRAR